VIATIGATSAMASDGQFIDVPKEGAGSFAHDPAEWAAANGLTTGCNSPGGGVIGDNFCPDSNVTRGQNITFTYRHHTELIEPLLAAIESDVADNAAAAAAAQTAADAAQTAAEDAQDTADEGQEDMLLSHGAWGLVGYEGEIPSTMDVVDWGMTISGDGIAGLPLDGPIYMHGTAWTLVGVRYCIRNIVGGAHVAEVAILGNTAPALMALDETARTDAGCYEVYTEDGPVMLADPPYNESFNFAFFVDGGDTLDVYDISSWWTPSDPIIIFAEGDSASSFGFDS